MDDACYSDPKRGSWEALGSGDTIPFDGGVLGAGEFEGRVQTLDEAKPKWLTDTPTAGVREQLVGSSPARLTEMLDAAHPRTEAPASTECGLDE